MKMKLMRELDNWPAIKQEIASYFSKRSFNTFYENIQLSLQICRQMYFYKESDSQNIFTGNLNLEEDFPTWLFYTVFYLEEIESPILLPFYNTAYRPAGETLTKLTLFNKEEEVTFNIKKVILVGFPSFRTVNRETNKLKLLKQNATQDDTSNFKNLI